MTSFKTTVQLDGKEVFSTLPYWRHPRKASDPYLEMELGKFELE